MENTERTKATNNFEDKSKIVALMDGLESVTLSVHRFEQLLKAETQLEIVRTAYTMCESWDLRSKLAPVFGSLPLPKGDDNA